MECGNFKQSFKDSDYRRKTEEAISNSRIGVEIIGSTLRHINYPEILYSIKDARKSGVAVSVYFTSGSKRITDFLKQSDVNLYKGKEKFSDEDYIVVDGGKLIASTLEGDSRVGYWTSWTRDPDKIEDVIDRFDAICNQSERIHLTMGPVRERLVEYSPPTDKEIQERINFHDHLAHEIGKKVNPKLLNNLEASIRADRERPL